MHHESITIMTLVVKVSTACAHENRKNRESNFLSIAFLSYSTDSSRSRFIFSIVNKYKTDHVSKKRDKIVALFKSARVPEKLFIVLSILLNRTVFEHTKRFSS